jgi:hypothetical protein
MSEEVKSESEKKKEDWMNSKWRPMMGWMYMVVCTMDMVIFPILWSLLQTLNHAPITQWNPLTLQGAGLFHIAMGAVLGLAAWGRTQEKLGGANNGGLQPLPSSNTATFGQPAAGGFGSTSSFGPPATNSTPSSFGGGGFGSMAPQPAPTGFGGGFGGPVATTATGKKIVPDEPQPVL